MRARNLIVVVAVCASARVAAAEPAPPPPLADSDAHVLSYLHSIDQLDIDVGTLAERRGSPALRVFGATLVSDHAALDKRIVELARRHGIRTIPMDAPIDPDHRPVANAQGMLKSLRGVAFDKAFLDVMPDAEDAEARAIEDAIATVADPEIEQILRDAEPQVKAHVVAVQTLKSSR